MILVDTSAWIAFFRDRGAAAALVDSALSRGHAALCGPVLTELRRGLRPAERTRVLYALEGCSLLAEPADLWTAAGDLGAALARKGTTVKTLDLLIATYAIAHDVALLTADRDFQAIARAGFGLVLAH